MRRSGLLAVGVAVGLVLGGGVASATLRPPTSVRACADKAGTLSLLVKGKCAKGSVVVKLNAAGPRGLSGVAGASGAAGAPGTPGTPGSPGAPGLPGAVGPSDTWEYRYNVGPFNTNTVSAPSFDGSELQLLNLPAGEYNLHYLMSLYSIGVQADGIDGCVPHYVEGDTTYVGSYLTVGTPAGSTAGDDNFGTGVLDEPFAATAPTAVYVTCTTNQGPPVIVYGFSVVATETGALHVSGHQPS